MNTLRSLISWTLKTLLLKPRFPESLEQTSPRIMRSYYPEDYCHADLTH